MTDQEAIGVSQVLAEGDAFPEFREVMTRELFDYYKTLLYREQVNFPTPRRWE
jgi:hypothetical protein